MIKIDVISGFLGAGKTTLIKKLFESGFKKQKVVIIENEFGDISIDKGFLKESGVQIKEINAGCICCSLVGDFASSITELIDTYSPNRIIIEPSGVGKLSDIVNAIKNVNNPDLYINILATVVDGKKAKIYLKNFGEFFLNQIEAANNIVISKTESLDEEKLHEVLHLVKEHNSKANIITTPLNQLDGKVLLKTLESHKSLIDELVNELHDEHHEEHCCCHEHEHEHHHHDDHCCCHEHEHEHHHADEVFTSWGLETTKSFTKDQLDNFLNQLANDETLGIVLRAKGFVKAKDNEKWYYFDFVSGDYEIRLGEPDYTGRVVVIGSNLNKEKVEGLYNNI